MKIIYHFVGNGGMEGDYHAIQQRLCNEIRDLYALPQPDGNTAVSKKLEDELNELLMEVAGREPLLIVLDGINQLSEAENAKQLLWLPILPANVKYIFSTLPDDRTMEVFKIRHYPVYTLKSLDTEGRRRLVKAYLKEFGKELSQERVERIVRDPQSENTLVLRSLLDELIGFGSHERLDERISYYLAAQSIGDFFQRVLQRIEDDLGARTVRHILSLIAFSQYGLSETEIMEIVGLNAYDWSVFLGVFRNYFTVKSGMLTFSHRYMTEACVARYASDERDSRHEIISMFAGQDDGRAWDELAFQYCALSDTDNLYALLLRLEVFDFLNKKDEYQLGGYWRLLLQRDEKKYTPAAYLEQNADDNNTGYYYSILGIFFCNIVIDLSDAILFHRKSLSFNEKNSHRHEQGTYYYLLGQQEKRGVLFLAHATSLHLANRRKRRKIMNTRDDGTRTISILPWVILGLLFMFLPLSNKFFPGVDGEPAVFSAAILCTCLLVVACVAGGWKSRVGLQLVPTDLFFLLYLVYATVRWGVLAVHTLDPLVYCEWFTIVLIYLLARCLPARGFLLFLVFFGVSGLIQAVMGIGQANAWLPPGNLTFPVTGTFNNPGPFAGYLALVLVCAFSALTRSSNLPVKQNVPLLLTCLLLALALILSNSRAAWLAVVLPVGLYVGQQLPASRSRSLALKISMVVLLLLLVLFLYVYKKDSADVRLLTWRAGFSLFLDAPIWGHGVGGFASNYMNYQARFLNAHPGSYFAYLADNNTIAFNDYLRLLCEQGVVGFILFMALLLSGLFSLGRRPLSLPQMALFSLCVFAFFSYPASTFPLKVCFPLFLGMTAREQSPFRVFQCPRGRLMALSCLLLVGLLPVFRATS